MPNLEPMLTIFEFAKELKAKLLGLTEREVRDEFDRYCKAEEELRSLLDSSRETKRPGIDRYDESWFDRMISGKSVESLMATAKEIHSVSQESSWLFPKVALLEATKPVHPFEKVVKEMLADSRTTSECLVTLKAVVTDFCKTCNSHWLTELFHCDRMRPGLAPDGYMLAMSAGPRSYSNLAFALEMKTEEYFLPGMASCFMHIYHMLAAEPRREMAACMLVTEVRAVMFVGLCAPGRKMVDMRECALQLSDLPLKLRALLQYDPGQFGVPEPTGMEIGGRPFRPSLSCLHKGCDKTVFLDCAEMFVLKTGTHSSIERESAILSMIQKEEAFSKVRSHLPEHLGFVKYAENGLLITKPFGRHLCMVNGGDNIIQILTRLGEVEQVLQVAHQLNIFHRDVSYSNILETDEGAVLIDWGSAADGSTAVPPKSLTGVSKETDDSMRFKEACLFMADDVLDAAHEQRHGEKLDDFVYCGRHDMQSLYFVMLHVLQNGSLPWYRHHFVQQMSDSGDTLFILRVFRHGVINKDYFADFVDSTVVSEANRVVFDRVMKISRELYVKGTFSIRVLLSRLEE